MEVSGYRNTLDGLDIMLVVDTFIVLQIRIRNLNLLNFSIL